MRYHHIKRYNKRALYANAKKQSLIKKNLFIFFSSQWFSLLGSTIVSFSIIWYITLTTSSATLVAISIICTYIPQIIISIFAGSLGDKYNKKLLIILGDAITAFATLVLVILFFLGYQSIYLIYLLCIFRSIGSGIQIPLENAFIATICPKNLLQKINSIYSILNSIINMISPTIAALLLNFYSFEFILCIDFITAIIAISLFQKIKYHEYTHFTNTNNTDKTLFSSFKDGIIYLKTNTYLRYSIFFFLIFYFFMSVPGFLTPVLVSTKFSNDSIYLAINETSWFLGNCLGGFIMYKLTINSKLYAMTLSCFLFGILILNLGLANNFIFYIIIMFFSGIIMPIFNTSNLTAIQENTAQFMLSRVFSNINILMNISTVIGILFFGIIGDFIAIDKLLILTGSFIMCLAFFIWQMYKRFSI